MSYCNVADIGRDAELFHVRAVARVIEERTSPYTFYSNVDGENSWLLSPVYTGRVGNSFRLNAIYTVQGDIDMKLYSDGILIKSGRANSVIGGIGNVLDIDADFWDGHSEFVLQGARGYAEPVALGSYVPEAGDSVLRGTSVVLVDDSYTQQVGDRILVPPDDLKMAAITIGRRMYKLMRDQNSQFDGGGRFDGLTDNLDEILMRYRV